MSEITIENNEFLRQFEVKVSDSLARIEYAEQERKIFLTKIHIPDNIKDKSRMQRDFIEEIDSMHAFAFWQKENKKLFLIRN